jgi:succinyl-diaminopimelate desuccinylase
MINLLHQLINIPSISRNEDAVVDFIAKYLDTCPGTYQRLGKNLLWRSPGFAPNKKTMVLIGHSDTVPWNEKNWKITKPTLALEQDGKIYGRGSCDMKGGVAIMLDLIKNFDYPLPVNLLGIVYHGEEVGIPNGLTEILDAKILPEVELAIILEPTDGEVVSGVFGCLDLQINLKGKACHSSRPELGENAIYKALAVAEQLQKIPLREVNGTIEALQVTKISGGTAVNILPESATLTVNMRCAPGQTVDAILARLPLAGLDYEILTWNLGGVAEGDFSALGKNVVEPFWTDIAQLIEAGIPAINFGPGSIEQAHTADEFVSIKSMEETRERLKQFLLR